MLAEFADLSVSILTSYGPSHIIFVVSFFICTVIIALNLLVAIFLDVLKQAREGPTIFNLTAEDAPTDDVVEASQLGSGAVRSPNGSVLRKPRTDSYFDETEMANIAVVRGQASLAG
jgi:hypothetical protein